MITPHDLPKEDYLKDLMQHVQLDSPSDDFVDRVMQEIQVVPQEHTSSKPIFTFLKSFFPYAALIIIILVVIGTSDLPFLNWIPGKAYYFENLAPYLNIFLTTIKNIFSSSYVSFGLLIGFSGGFLFLADKFLFSRFSRRKSHTIA